MAFGYSGYSKELDFDDGLMKAFDEIILIDLVKLFEFAGFVELYAFVIAALAKN